MGSTDLSIGSPVYVCLFIRARSNIDYGLDTGSYSFSVCSSTKDVAELVKVDNNSPYSQAAASISFVTRSDNGQVGIFGAALTSLFFKDVKSFALISPSFTLSSDFAGTLVISDSDNVESLCDSF